MNTLVTRADAKPAAPSRRKRLGQLFLLGLAAKVLVLVVGLGGGLELIRTGLSPYLDAVHGAASPQPSPTAD